MINKKINYLPRWTRKHIAHILKCNHAKKIRTDKSRLLNFKSISNQQKIDTCFLNPKNGNDFLNSVWLYLYMDHYLTLFPRQSEDSLKLRSKGKRKERGKYLSYT